MDLLKNAIFGDSKDQPYDPERVSEEHPQPREAPEGEGQGQGHGQGHQTSAPDQPSTEDRAPEKSRANEVHQKPGTDQTSKPRHTPGTGRSVVSTETYEDKSGSIPAMAEPHIGHTEPARRHTKQELLRPGRDHHLTAASEVPCPDPSVHGKSTKLQDGAASAALYGAKPEQERSVLDADGKLSSASAATSLKYAKAQDLPSFPVVGINTQSSGLQAATLAKDYKMAPLWRPGTSSEAGKAAILAKDYKMAPLWKPELSAAGSKAALLAHKDGGKLEWWQPQDSEAGHSAADQAMRKKNLSPQLDYGYTEDGRKRALMAATGALSGRSRSGSTPTPVALYPDQANAAHNALNAATMASRPSTTVKDSNRLDSPAMQAARVQNIGNNVPREMYTEHPPVAIEVEEKRHNEALRGAAISMAKKMYEVQQRRIDEASAAAALAPRGDGFAAAGKAHGRQPSADQDFKQQAMQYIHLQEAAQKLAAERLAKLEPSEASKYRSHYGYSLEQPRSRLSMRSRRGRANSDGQRSADSDDEAQARRVRSQMSQFNRELAEVDAKKRTQDRANLLAAAERKVQARMHDMDEKVFADTGKVSPAMMEEWEAKARARAILDSETRMKNHGKVHIGGGKFMDQSEIDAIAASRMQPTLDEITETAEKRRARDEEIRLDLEEKKRQAQTEKQREAETRAEQKRSKAGEKAAARSKKDEEKAAARVHKEAEKARRAEEKRIQKEETRKSREIKKQDETAIGPTVAGPTMLPEADTEAAPVVAGEDAADAGETAETAGVGATTSSDLDRHLTHDTVSSHEEGEVLVEGPEKDVIASRVLTAPVTDIEPTFPPLPTTEDTAITLSPQVTEDTSVVSPIHDDPVETPSTAAAGTTTAAPTASEFSKSRAEDSAKEPGTPASPTTKDSKGLKGIFSVFKRKSKTPTSTAPAGALSSSAAVTTSRASNDTGTAKAAASGSLDKDRASHDVPFSSSAAGVMPSTAAAAAPASPSSFTRHADKARRSGSISSISSISSLSSSSISDADETRGRTGRVAGAFSAFKTGKLGKKEKGKSQQTGVPGAAGGVPGQEKEGDKDSSDEFEEARDHFDESLAPPPSFGGAAKSESPVRGTRFQEEL